MIVHRVQKRRVLAMPCDFAVQSAAKEKNILPRRTDLRVDPPIPAVKRSPGVAGSRRKTRARGG